MGTVQTRSGPGPSVCCVVKLSKLRGVPPGHDIAPMPAGTPHVVYGPHTEPVSVPWALLMPPMRHEVLCCHCCRSSGRPYCCHHCHYNTPSCTRRTTMSQQHTATTPSGKYAGHQLYSVRWVLSVVRSSLGQGHCKTGCCQALLHVVFPVVWHQVTAMITLSTTTKVTNGYDVEHRQCQGLLPLL